MTLSEAADSKLPVIQKCCLVERIKSLFKVTNGRAVIFQRSTVSADIYRGSRIRSTEETFKGIKDASAEIYFACQDRHASCLKPQNKMDPGTRIRNSAWRDVYSLAELFVTCRKARSEQPGLPTAAEAQSDQVHA